MPQPQAQSSLEALSLMATDMLTNHESDTCPRVAAWMTGLAVAAGDRETAGAWLIELIAWMAFDAGRTTYVSTDFGPMKQTMHVARA